MRRRASEPFFGVAVHAFSLFGSSVQPPMARYSAFMSRLPAPLPPLLPCTVFGRPAHGSRGTVPSTDPDYPGWCIAEYASTAHEESILPFSVVLATWRNPGKGGAAAVSPFCCLGRGAPTSHDPNRTFLRKPASGRLTD